MALIIGCVVMSGCKNSGVTPVVYASGTEGVPLIRFISGTEYTYFDIGQTIVEILDYKIENKLAGECGVTILYPNKTIFITQQLNFTDGYGNYWNEFYIPNSTGVYEQEVVCNISGTLVKGTHTFHVSELRNIIINNQNVNFDKLSNITSEIYWYENDTSYYIKTNVSGDLEVLRNESTLIVSYSNQTLNFLLNNATNFFESTNTSLTHIINNTALMYDLMKELKSCCCPVESYTIDVWVSPYVKVGDIWAMQVQVLDNNMENVDNATCHLNATQFPLNINMSYDDRIERYVFYGSVHNTSQIVYSVMCEA